MGIRTTLQKAIIPGIVFVAMMPVLVAGAALVRNADEVKQQRQSSATACQAYNLATSKVHDGFAVKLVPQLRKFPVEDQVQWSAFLQALTDDFTFPPLDCGVYPIRFEP